MKFNKRIEWSEEKDILLIRERGISFEEIFIALQNGHLIEIYPHPKQLHQNIMAIEVEGYVVLVPFVEDNEKIFLKTAYHSRKAVKKYKGASNE